MLQTLEIRKHTDDKKSSLENFHPAKFGDHRHCENGDNDLSL